MPALIDDALTIRPCTPEEFRAMPESMAITSLIDGLLIVEDPPTDRHQQACINLILALGSETRRRRCGIIRNGPSAVWFDDRTLVEPDVYFVSNERLHQMGERGCMGAPDLAVEILSPPTQRLDRVRKRELYAHYGTKELWIVDPVLQEVIVYRFAESKDRPVKILGSNERLETALFPGWSLAVSEIYQP